MLFADVAFSTEAIAVIGALLGVVVAAYTKVGLLLLAAKDLRYDDMKSQRDSYKEMNLEALDALEKEINDKRRLDGRPPFVPILPVVPEHSSPVTPAQHDTAELQTHRARLTRSLHMLGMPPRTLEA